MRPHAALATLTCLLAAGTAAAIDLPGQRPGDRTEVRAADLPPPFATTSSRNPPERVARPDKVAPTVPPGFTATEFAAGLPHPRNLVVAPNGDVLLAQSRPGEITLLRDADRDGKAELVQSFANGFDRPFGLALHDGALWVADTKAVWRLPYRPGEAKPAGERRQVTPDGALGPATGHWTRSLAISPDGASLFVGVGSEGNTAEEPLPRAAIMEFALDGTPKGPLATGLRNPVGVGFRPGTDELYAVVNERDGLGDKLVPDYLVRVERGAFYGWPYSYIGRNPQPELAAKRPDLVERAVVPDLLFEAHSAPIGLAFYADGPFPAEWKDGAFAALRGSWNTSEPTGYKVVFVPFQDGKPAGHYVTFAAGFWVDGLDRANVWGRPAGLAVAPDGSLLVADDTGGGVWRIAYGNGRVR